MLFWRRVDNYRNLFDDLRPRPVPQQAVAPQQRKSPSPVLRPRSSLSAHGTTAAAAGANDSSTPTAVISTAAIPTATRGASMSGSARNLQSATASSANARVLASSASAAAVHALVRPERVKAALDEAMVILETYLAPNAPFEINVSGGVRRDTDARLTNLRMALALIQHQHGDNVAALVPGASHVTKPAAEHKTAANETRVDVVQTLHSLEEIGAQLLQVYDDVQRGDLYCVLRR